MHLYVCYCNQYKFIFDSSLSLFTSFLFDSINRIVCFALLNLTSPLKQFHQLNFYQLEPARHTILLILLVYYVFANVLCKQLCFLYKLTIFKQMNKINKTLAFVQVYIHNTSFICFFILYV
jgi:hypothetical protein